MVFNVYTQETQNNKTIHIENPKKGLWHGKKKVLFQEVLCIGQDDEHYLAIPFNVVTDDKQNIYISDYGENYVKIFNSHGKFLRQIGGSGQGPGEITNIGKGLAILNQENIICLCDEYKGFGTELEFYKTDGEFIKSVKLNFGAWDMIASKTLPRLYLAQRVRMFLGSERLEKLNNFGSDPHFVIHAYDLNGNLINRFCEFDIVETGNQKYQSEFSYITLLSDGNLAVTHNYPYKISIFNAEGIHEKTITRKNDLFKKLEVQKEIKGVPGGNFAVFEFSSPATVKEIFSLPRNMFIVQIDTKNKDRRYIYDIYSNDGTFLLSFWEMKKIIHIDALGQFYEREYTIEGIPVIRKYKFNIVNI